MKKTKAALREELDRLGLEWYHCPPEDDAVRKSLEWKIFENVYALFQPPEGHPDHQIITEAISVIYQKDMLRFDPAKNASLSAFIGGRVKRRGIDIDREDRGLKREEAEDPVTGEKKARWVDPFVRAAEEDDPLEAVSTGLRDRPEAGVELDATAAVLIKAMLQMPFFLNGQANNSTRHNYFRLFFTEGVVSAIHCAETEASFTRHERDLFQAMKVEFLDFFMARQCRDVPAIRSSALKPYGSLVDNKPMDEEPPQPLPYDVYISYLDRVEGYRATPSSISPKKQAYKQFLKRVLN